MITSTKNSKGEKMVIGFTITAWLITLLVLITCTSNGQRSILEHQTIEKLTDSSLYFGKRVKQIQDVTECAILKTDDLDSLLCQAQNLLTKLQYLPTLDSVYCPSLVRMPKKCSQIKLYPYQSTTRSSSSPFKMVWTGQKRSLHIVFRHQN